MGLMSGIQGLLGKGERCCNDDALLAGVQLAYSAAASDPFRQHPFPVGKSFAESVGYPKELLDSLPDEASASFAGVGNVGVVAEIGAASTVLDLGCGTGLDSLLAAAKAGPSGRVVGVDFSAAMLGKAIVASRRAGAKNILYCCADAGRLPLPGHTIDVALVNGIFNLNPVRGRLFMEMARVLKPGGVVHATELVFTRPQETKPVRNLKDWFA